MLPASALNALRREGVAAMDALRIRENTPNYSIHKAPTLPAESTQQKTEAGHFRILLPRWSETAVQLLADPVTQGILLPMDQLPEEIPKPFRDRIFLTLPRFCPAEETLSAQLKRAKEKGISHLVCENVAHLYLGERLGFYLHGGLGLNVANSHCLHFLKSQNLVDTLLSPELTTKQIATCHGLPFGVYAYGNQPVMTMRNCPIQNEIGCKACQHQLTDRTGRQFPVYCHKPSDSVTMYNAVPTWMADKLSGLSACAFFLLDCTLTADPIRILSAYKARKEPDTSITRGLFYRGVE
jgi:putative protease